MTMAQPSQTDQMMRRVARTGIQIVMGGALTFIATYVVQQFGPNLGATPISFILMAATWLTSLAQNYGEKQGWIPIILPNSHPPAQPVTPAVESTK
jgi:hypothetical protein